MKKVLIAIFILMACPLMALAQNRGRLSNMYASWANVSHASDTNFTFPYSVRDLYIRNGASNTNVCVDLTGSTTPDGCFSASYTNPTVILLEANSEIRLYDIATSSIAVRGITGSASPVTVIATY